MRGVSLKFVTLDFETFYDKEYSLSKLNTEAYVRDPRFEVILVGVKINNEPPTWFSGTMAETKAFLEGLQLQDAFLLAHHMQFDGFILAHHFGIVPRFYLDTLSMSRPEHQMTVGGSLKALADKYTVGVKGDEVVRAIGLRRRDFTAMELETYAKYCMNDTQLCYLLFKIMQKGFPRDELKVIDLFMRMYTQPLVELDTEFLSRHLTMVQQRRAALAAKLDQYGGKEVVMSNPKFAELLRSFGAEPPMKISITTGKPTFAFAKNDLAFKEMLDHPDELVRTAVEVRLGLKTTIEESRTQALMEIGRRGPWPIYLNYYGAHTGRASGGDGVNPQNMHRGGALRKAVKAPPGYKIVAGDSAQIEARVTAYIAGQHDLVEDFRNKIDIYSKFASVIYGRPIDRKKKLIQVNGEEFFPDFNEGFVGKTCILGLGFGMGGTKLQRTLEIGQGGIAVSLPLEKCKEIVSLYRSQYRCIPKLWQDGERALYAITRGEEFTFGQGLLKTSREGIHLPNGMLVRYPGLTFLRGEGFVYAKNRKEQAEWVKQQLSGNWDANLLTRIYGGKVIENVVQALARIVVFEQMLKIAPHYRVVLTVHDEVVTCVPEAHESGALSHITTTMSTAPTWAPTLPVACEVHSGGTYGEAK